MKIVYHKVPGGVSSSSKFSQKIFGGVTTRPSQCSASPKKIKIFEHVFVLSV
jgi:hypothetical protein